MEKEFDFRIMLSLKELTLRKTSIILFSTYDVVSFFAASDLPDRVKEEISTQLLLPEITERCLKLFKIYLAELETWMSFHVSCFGWDWILLDEKLATHISWTDLGTIHYQKTAEKLINDKVYQTVKLYVLACIYCLDSYIPSLWEQLSEEEKNRFYKETSPEIPKRPQLEFCWPYILKGEESKLDYMSGRRLGDPVTFNQYAFEFSADMGNLAATKYFFEKLTATEKGESLVKTARTLDMPSSESQPEVHPFPSVKLCDVFVYLLSQMTLEQRMQVCKEEACVVLNYLLEWPWQDLFLPTAKLVSDFIPEKGFGILLWRITRKINSDKYFTKIFYQFFVLGPSEFRSHFVNNTILVDTVMCEFFKTQNSEAIIMIFNNLDSENKKNLVFSEKLFLRFYHAFLKKNASLVGICLREANLTESDKEELKAAFCRFLEGIEKENKERKRIWEEFLRCLNEENSSKDPGKKNSKKAGISVLEKKCIAIEDNFTVQNNW